MRLIRGRGTRAARRARKSRGSKTRWLVPSDSCGLELEDNAPIGGESESVLRNRRPQGYRQSCSRPSRSSPRTVTLAWRSNRPPSNEARPARNAGAALWQEAGHAGAALWQEAGHAGAALWQEAGHAGAALWQEAGHAGAALWQEAGHAGAALWQSPRGGTLSDAATMHSGRPHRRPRISRMATAFFARPSGFAGQGTLTEQVDAETERML